MPKTGGHEKPTHKQTFKETVREYWPLMLVGLGVLAVLVYSVTIVVRSPDNGRWVIFGGTVISSTPEGVTFDNVSIEPYKRGGIMYPENQTVAILNRWGTGDCYTIDLGWYNDHVKEGLHYGVSAKYEQGRLVEVTVTR
jgi:hypothetical protein